MEKLYIGLVFYSLVLVNCSLAISSRWMYHSSRTRSPIYYNIYQFSYAEFSKRAFCCIKFQCFCSVSIHAQKFCINPIANCNKETSSWGQNKTNSLINKWLDSNSLQENRAPPPVGILKLSTWNSVIWWRSYITRINSKTLHHYRIHESHEGHRC